MGQALLALNLPALPICANANFMHGAYTTIDQSTGLVLTLIVILCGDRKHRMLDVFIFVNFRLV